MWGMVVSSRTRRVYAGLFVVGIVLSLLAAALADEVSVSLLAGAVTAALAATLWREASTWREWRSGEIQVIGEGVGPPAISRTESQVQPLTTVDRGRVESWDDDTGWAS